VVVGLVGQVHPEFPVHLRLFGGRRLSEHRLEPAHPLDDGLDLCCGEPSCLAVGELPGNTLTFGP
jgi:hypothetical protein